MALFNISAWKKNAVNQGQPLWESTITAGDVEEAYRIGKSQFETERPEMQHEEISIKAAEGYREKEF